MTDKPQTREEVAIKAWRNAAAITPNAPSSVFDARCFLAMFDAVRKWEAEHGADTHNRLANQHNPITYKVEKLMRL